MLLIHTTSFFLSLTLVGRVGDAFKNTAVGHALRTHLGPATGPDAVGLEDFNINRQPPAAFVHPFRGEL